MNHEIALKHEINKTIPALLNRETTDKEALYQELKELCLELGIPYIESYIDIMYGYPDKPTEHWEGYPRRMNSWVRNAYNQWFSQMAGVNISDATPNWGTGFINIKDTSGAIISASNTIYHDGVNPNHLSVENADVHLRNSVNTDDAGILVGSSATAESFEHYGLQTQLTEPNTTHAVMSAPTRSQDGLINKVAYSRTLTNASGGQLTYRETALVGRYSNTPYYYMLSRDLITPALTLNNTGYLVPTYTMSLTYPS